ncbi:ankyrin repeat domain-containing protein [Aureispira anguillae]|uniref:Ankyrin repeat domain-containing protein n=1 Tax=Aureispira anguillae TaxID=2864201 RepID=A0A916DRL2_9BACT|nr:ankyrin repeat domain-containing protein [Aureispira anguillae]BDS10467.1 ankyrin repeat domain-containing protein [Aureispira anguillae]
MSNFLSSEIVLAAEEGSVDNVLQLLQQGASPNAIGANSGALHAAAFMGHKAVVKALLKHGGDPNIKDKQNFYPLHLAASEGHTAICNLLLKAGANKEALTTSGGTALHIAAASNFAATVVALIKGGCDKEAKDLDGSTPLLTASALGNEGVVKSLLKSGADIKATNHKGNNALMQALWTLHAARIEQWEYEDVKDEVPVRYEIKKGCLKYYYNYNKFAPKPGRIMTLKEQRNVALQAWGAEQHLDYLNALAVVKYLIKKGVDVNQTDRRAISPLRVACYAGVGSIIKLLHHAGARFDALPWQHITQLHQVAGSGRLDGLQTFFKLADAKDINARDANGWTPAHYLADTGGPLEMADLLIKHGADVSILSTAATQNFPQGISAGKVAMHWKDLDLAMALA